MANARDRDTYVHRKGVTPETASVISSKNRIYAVPADGEASTIYQIGVVATFDPSETRTIEPVRGIGFGDHVAELVPGVTEPLTMAVTRTAQYLSMIYQVFGYKGGIDGLVRSLRHHRWPFDIVQEIIMSNLPDVVDQATAASSGSPSPVSSLSDTYKAIMTYYQGCWISDYSVSYAADAALVQESVTINVTDILADTGTAYDETTDLFNMGAMSKIIKADFNPNTAGRTGGSPASAGIVLNG
jgi:hypothetical protein